MDDIDFTDEEKQTISYYARVTDDHYLFYAATLTPLFCLGGYGFLRTDALALEMAFTGAMLYIGWMVFSGLKNRKTQRSIFRKIEAAQRGARPSSAR